jgi:hypothetical protein
MGIKLFNCLPLNLKQLYKDVKWFQLKLKELLLLLLFILSLAVKNYNWTCQPITASHKRKQANIYTLIYHYNIGTHLRITKET